MFGPAVDEVVHLLESNLLHSFVRSREFVCFLADGAEPVESLPSSRTLSEMCLHSVSLSVTQPHLQTRAMPATRSTAPSVIRN